MSNINDLFNNADMQRLELCKNCKRPDYETVKRNKKTVEVLRSEILNLKFEIDNYKRKIEKIAELEKSISNLNTLLRNNEIMNDFLKKRVEQLFGAGSWRNLFKTVDAPEIISLKKPEFIVRKK